MRRFFRADLPKGGTFPLEGDEGMHLARVLRARPGDEVGVFDGRGREVRCRVVSVDRRGDVVLEVAGPVEPRRPRRDVLLCTAVPRGERMEWLVEKCVEAGVGAIAPWAAARSVRESAGASTLRRWRRAALEAAKQCGRADVPDVADVAPLADAIRAAAARVLLAADPSAGAPLADVLASLGGGPAPVAIFVGPEGGLTDEETSALTAAGARGFSLGPLVLRIETAAAIAVHAAAI